jgi:hypothetical protein
MGNLSYSNRQIKKDIKDIGKEISRTFSNKIKKMKNFDEEQEMFDLNEIGFNESH